MKLLFLTVLAIPFCMNSFSQTDDTIHPAVYHHQLEDVMELTDTTLLKLKLVEVENQYRLNPGELNTARLGIIYHEAALNLSFFSKTRYKGYAKRSFDTLSRLFNASKTSSGLLSFIASYRASALSLVAAETNKLTLLGTAFKLFEESVQMYSEVSYLPEFLRGSVAENLPWFFIRKRRSARHDFSSIILKQEKQGDYANPKIMSFTYWARAMQLQSKKQKKQALLYLDKAIQLDPEYKAGRAKAEALKLKMNQ